MQTQYCYPGDGGKNCKTVDVTVDVSLKEMEPLSNINCTNYLGFYCWSWGEGLMVKKRNEKRLNSNE